MLRDGLFLKLDGFKSSTRVRRIGGGGSGTWGRAASS